ncbi:MAG: phosphoglucosamine mutase [Bacteroidales bacterium]
MTLIRSISGIRGTIGGVPGMNLTPPDVVKYASAYAAFIKNHLKKEGCRVVIGRDARISGAMVSGLVANALMGMGVDVVDLGLSTTPTVEMMVPELKADGGVVITASHNPREWNALKLLDHNGEFLSFRKGQEVLSIADESGPAYVPVDDLGVCTIHGHAMEYHVERILALDLVKPEKIRRAGYTVVLDAVNSTGGLAIVPMLKALGVKKVVELYTEPTGAFPHHPEPLPENLTALTRKVRKHKADMGFVVDPDVDRLAIVTEKGGFFGEEYTLVAVADYVLKHISGDTVSNLSSTRALKDVTEAHGYKYYASAVGEVNVVEKMKQTGAVIGGEGNGGVIYPALHYGRDALVGIALFLTHLAEENITCSELRKKYPAYHISKNRVELSPEVDLEGILLGIKDTYKDFPVSMEDGLKIDFPHGWVHLRKSNTEPVIRIYSEAKSEHEAENLASELLKDINNRML